MQEEYDAYMNCKLKEFKRVARLLVGDGKVSEEAICAVSKAMKGDIFARRASEWAKEKEKLSGYIQDKEETESVIEAQVSFATANNLYAMATRTTILYQNDVESL